jgi:hypothetical protein
MRTELTHEQSRWTAVDADEVSDVIVAAIATFRAENMIFGSAARK